MGLPVLELACYTNLVFGRAVSPRARRSSHDAIVLAAGTLSRHPHVPTHQLSRCCPRGQGGFTMSEERANGAERLAPPSAQITQNSHYISRFLTKPWEGQQRRLHFFDFASGQFDMGPSRHLFA